MSSFRRFLSRPFGWLIAVAVFLGLAVPLAWATLAIYYSNLPWAGARMGLAAAFEAAAYIIWGTTPLTLPPVLSTQSHHVLGFNVTAVDVFCVLLAIVLGIAVAVGMRYTRVGIQMRATADGQQLAAYSGIHVTRISALAWGVGAALAGAGDGRARLRQAMADYIAFANRRPGLHRLMFESDFLRREPRPPPLVAPTERTHLSLRRLVEAAYPEAGDAWLRRRTVTLLSTIVGFMVLDSVDRFKAYMVGPITHDDLVDSVLESAIGSPPSD